MLATEISQQYGNIGTGRVCRVLKLSRSSYGYQSKKDDTAIADSLLKLADNHPREGFWKAYYRLRNEGTVVNHKRLHRVYKELRLPLRRKTKKRLPARTKQKLCVPAELNDTWSIDFMSDALTNGRKFRSFHVLDDRNREALFIETDYSIKSGRVIWVLNHLINKRSKPRCIRMDNGPEFISKLAGEWAMMHGINFIYTQPGKPTQNAYIERFNGTYRRGVLDAYLFDNIDEVREISQQWMHDYNHKRPHDALGGKPPVPWKCGQQTNALPHAFPDHIPTAILNSNG